MAERFAFVTAGAAGLGQAIVRALFAAGWNVAFTYHTSAYAAAELVEAANSSSGRMLAIQADLLLQTEVERAAAKALAAFGQIDALIHNFGPFVFERLPLAEYSDEMWRQMHDGNLTNLFWLYRAFAPGMRERAFGRVITVGYDGAGDARGWRYRAAYAAAKSGLASLTRSIAREERQNGITANMVCPGDIRGKDKTRMIADVKDVSSVAGRPAVGGDVARLVTYLCDVDSQHINGTITELTGGYDVLAYDDGQDVVFEPRVFTEGESVWVTPWQQQAVITSISKIANRNQMYEVVAEDGRSGSFTAFQLKQVEPPSRS